MLEQVVDSHRQIVVRIHQASRGHDTVTVVIRIVGEGQIELIAQRQQTRHRTLGGAVHADRAIFIQVHKAERLIDLIVNDGQIQLVVLADAFPVFDTRTAQRIDAQFQARLLNSRHIDDIRQPFNKWLYQVLLFHVAGSQRGVERNTLHTLQTGGQQFISAVLHHFSHVGISRAAVWRVVLDTAIFRRVVRRGDDDTIRQRAAFFVMHQNRVGNRRRRGETVVFLNDHINTVRRQHFQHGNEGRFG